MTWSVFLTSIDPQMLELLEIISALEAKSKGMRSDDLALKSGYSLNRVGELLEIALRESYVESVNGTLRLTGRGRVEVQRHRERYVHDRYVHKRGFLGRVARLVEGGIMDWRSHWRHKHGFDENSLEGFYANIHHLEGRVEEVSSLADLRRGEKGTVAFAVGGHGLVRRLAEMGLTPGTEVTVQRSAPLHGPIEVSVRGVSLALGRGVASKIFVKRCGRNEIGS